MLSLDTDLTRLKKQSGEIEINCVHATEVVLESTIIHEMFGVVCRPERFQEPADWGRAINRRAYKLSCNSFSLTPRMEKICFCAVSRMVCCSSS